MWGAVERGCSRWIANEAIGGYLVVACPGGATCNPHLRSGPVV